MIYDTPFSNYSRVWLREIADMEHDCDEMPAPPARNAMADSQSISTAQTEAVSEAASALDDDPDYSKELVRYRERKVI